MPAWGWFALGVLLSALGTISIYLLLRKTSGVETVDRAGLLSSERIRLGVALEAETLARAAAERVARALSAELRDVAERRRSVLEGIDASERARVAELVGDPDALLARLDAVLRQR